MGLNTPKGFFCISTITYYFWRDAKLVTKQKMSQYPEGFLLDFHAHSLLRLEPAQAPCVVSIPRRVSVFVRFCKPPKVRQGKPDDNVVPQYPSGLQQFHHCSLEAHYPLPNLQSSTCISCAIFPHPAGRSRITHHVSRLIPRRASSVFPRIRRI